MKEDQETKELQELVTKTLEASGVIGKIRAQLRANVFLALDQQEKAASHVQDNPRLRSLLHTAEGRNAFDLIREFLEFYNLEYTLAVLVPEAHLATTHKARDTLVRDLGLSPSKLDHNKPVLLSVLEGNQVRMSAEDSYADIRRKSDSEKSTPTASPRPEDGHAGLQKKKSFDNLLSTKAVLNAAQPAAEVVDDDDILNSSLKSDASRTSSLKSKNSGSLHSKSLQSKAIDGDWRSSLNELNTKQTQPVHASTSLGSLAGAPPLFTAKQSYGQASREQRDNPLSSMGSSALRLSSEEELDHAPKSHASSKKDEHTENEEYDSEDDLNNTADNLEKLKNIEDRLSKFHAEGAAPVTMKAHSHASASEGDQFSESIEEDLSVEEDSRLDKSQLSKTESDFHTEDQTSALSSHDYDYVEEVDEY
eukprot:Colp12_sorted_trinity150504_noHs@5491